MSNVSQFLSGILGRSVRLLRVTGVCLVLGACSPDVERRVDSVPLTPEGEELAEVLKGTWQFVAREVSTCPTGLVLNPFDGRVRISNTGIQMVLQSLDIPALSIDMSAASSDRLVHATTLQFDSCRFEETHDVSIMSVSEDRISGAYTLNYEWSDSRKCRDVAATFANGVSQPCRLDSSWVGTRLPDP